MGYGNESKVRCNWSASCLWRFRGASGRETGFAKSLGIQDQAGWSRQCAAVQARVSLGRKSPNQRHWLPGYICTDRSLGPRFVGSWDHHWVRSRKPSNGRIHGFLGSWLGLKKLYSPTAGILSFAPASEPIQWSKINKNFVEDGTLLEKVSLWPEVILACLVRHFWGLRDLDWFRCITCWRRTVCARGSRYFHCSSRSVGRWSPYLC